ncbi:MAG: CoB--CoM heterodisulfide reductase iron-sulfur subunit A family protein [Dehalococcoidia bacterium]|nr:CoB--CoM heterodisulfide reductase iron-sulfur subunit A family protein [Dehalococcoidia bacterium]
MKMGVYICHCGTNIAGTVNVEEVAEFARTLPGVVVGKHYMYMCSDPGQEMIVKDIKEQGLDRVLIAACTPNMHTNAFRLNVQKGGLNPYLLSRANIREQCSQVHPNVETTTLKAERLVAAAVAQASLLRPLEAKEVGVTPAALVVGGGIAGIQAALDLGTAGFKVYLIERQPSLGGHVAELDKTFVTLESTSTMLAPKIAALSELPNVEVFTSSELTSVEGYIGNFKAKVNKEPVSAGDGCEQKAETVEFEVGAIILATGFGTFDPRLKPEYGYGRYPNVITSLELERLASPSGPTQGKIQINGKEPRNVVFIQCFGSRDKVVGNRYCSRVCCMYTAKQAHYIKSRFPDAKVTVCYIDIRAFGKGYEEFYEDVQKEGVIYRKGSVSEIYKKGDKVAVRAEDTLMGEMFEEEADMVVLAVGMVPKADVRNLTNMLRIAQSSDGFFLEAHPKLGPVETNTDGIYLAGCCQGPKDITDAVTQAHAAACKAAIPLIVGTVKRDPLTASIDEEVCAGCRMCESVCEYGALVFNKRRRIMTVNELLCRGCGACSATCPSGANQTRNSSKKQMMEVISVLV